MEVRFGDPRIGGIDLNELNELAQRRVELICLQAREGDSESRRSADVVAAVGVESGLIECDRPIPISVEQFVIGFLDSRRGLGSRRDRRCCRRCPRGRECRGCRFRRRGRGKQLRDLIRRTGGEDRGD